MYVSVGIMRGHLGLGTITECSISRSIHVHFGDLHSTEILRLLGTLVIVNIDVCLLEIGYIYSSWLAAHHRKKECTTAKR